MLEFNKQKKLFSAENKEDIEQLKVEVNKLKQDNLTISRELKELKFKFEHPPIYKVTQLVEDAIIIDVQIKTPTFADFLRNKQSWEYTLFNTKTGQTKKCDEHTLTELFNTYINKPKN